MTQPDFDHVTQLAFVRMLKMLLEELDVHVGENIKDEEHAVLRRTIRTWESRLLEQIGTPRRSLKKGESA